VALGAEYAPAILIDTAFKCGRTGQRIFNVTHIFVHKQILLSQYRIMTLPVPASGKPDSATAVQSGLHEESSTSGIHNLTMFKSG
jgi:hypothetical protein